ncbi:MAG: EutN/CcmL family microcompartment protein [Deferribacteres bacterium]|nr:EutN/CcmL family microcompartment protein [candidate division KSB1 bacterium]MCB9502412.1 EutN/CcmL family microcompartment protein [Deferribacteres bacterium]
MVLGKVTGSIVSTIKHGCYANKKLMLVKPISPGGETKKGVMVVVDTVGAGKGDIVLVASEGKGAAELLHFECQMPLRSIIIAIVDSIDLEKTN